MKPWKFLNRRNKIALLTIALSGSFLEHIRLMLLF